MEIAVATNTSPGQWWHESDEVLATALDVLVEQAEAMKAKRKGRKGSG